MPPVFLSIPLLYGSWQLIDLVTKKSCFKKFLCKLPYTFLAYLDQQVSINFQKHFPKLFQDKDPMFLIHQISFYLYIYFPQNILLAEQTTHMNNACILSNKTKPPILKYFLNMKIKNQFIKKQRTPYDWKLKILEWPHEEHL